MQVEASATPLLTADKVEKKQQQKFVNLVARVLQLTCAAMLDRHIQEEKLNGCHGCVIQHLSQREDTCLMMNNKEACLFYHEEARENINVNDVLTTANRIYSLIGFKLGNSWKTYVRELPKFPWASLYLTSMELKKFDERTQTKQLEDCILSFCQSVIWGDSVVRIEEEEPVNIDFTISEIQNKLFSSEK